jgi:hypothetical protein
MKLSACAILVVLMSLMNVGDAFAQNNCLASFHVDLHKSLTFFGWLPDGSGAGVSSMSCVAAENMRVRIFVDYLGGSQDTIFSSPHQYTDELTRRHDALIQKRDELRQKLDSGSDLGALRAVGKVLWYESEKFFTILACVAADPEPLTKAGCVVGLIDVVRATADLGDSMSLSDIKQQLTLIQNNLADIEPLYQARIHDVNQTKVNSARAKFSSAFTGLCQAVKQQCLH